MQRFKRERVLCLADRPLSLLEREQALLLRESDLFCLERDLSLCLRERLVSFAERERERRRDSSLSWRERETSLSFRKAEDRDLSDSVFKLSNISKIQTFYRCKIPKHQNEWTMQTIWIFKPFNDSNITTCTYSTIQIFQRFQRSQIQTCLPGRFFKHSKIQAFPFRQFQIFKDSNNQAFLEIYEIAKS